MASTVHGRLRLHANFRLCLAVLIVGAAMALLFAPARTHVNTASATGVHLASAPAAPGSLSSGLARLATTAPAQRVEVIIQLDRGVAQAQGRALVRSVGGRAGPSLHIINGLSARLTAGAARRLAASRLVHAVSLNETLKQTDVSGDGLSPWALSTTFDQSVGATRLWRRTTGNGIGVAVIDTGVNGSLPDFRNSRSDPTSRVIASAVIDPNATTANDTYGHGTAVAGLIAGDGGYRNNSDSLQGQYAGSAPNANLIAVKVADDNGQATTLDAIYGLQFAVDHQSQYNIRVINMSFRSTAAESYKTDPLDAAAEQAWFHGISVVTAAGNMGTVSDAVSYAPGNDPYVITVGAVDDQGTGNTSDDTVATWSSQGTTQDGFAKPDVLAPGAHIVSTLSPGSQFASLCPTCVIGGSYFQVSGTSLAAPIVAGVAADLIAAHPGWTPDMVKGAIVNSAVPVQGGDELNAAAAVWANGGQLVSDQNLTPSTLIDPSTGSIDYTQASWSMGSWSTATDPLAASWSAASWSCESCSAGPGDGSGSDSDNGAGSDVAPTAASWSTVGWTTFWG
jgi:serine protease AprX